MQYLRWSRVALLSTLGFALFLSLLPAVAAAQEEKPDGHWQKRLVADTDKLLALATDLKAQVDKSTKDTLSVDVIKKAEEIEKLARSVKERMKG